MRSLPPPAYRRRRATPAPPAAALLFAAMLLLPSCEAGQPGALSASAPDRAGPADSIDSAGSAAPSRQRAAAHGRADDPAGQSEPEATKLMVAAAHPLAVEAGLEMLRAGGSAVDAAIATEMVLTLVEPQSSGIGGGAFLVHLSKDGALTTYDGRETAPAAAGGDLFLRDDGTPMEFFEAVVGGRSVGVPGFMRMAELAHKDHGTLPWAQLFEPAIRLSENGFPVSERLARQIAEDKYLDTFEAARAYFFTADGAPKPAGTILRNPALAETLRHLAQAGADAFYDGPLAEDIVAAVRSTAHNPGQLTPKDMETYRAKERPALCGPYRRWLVCGMGPPTSGGLAVLQTLGILEEFDLSGLDPNSAKAVHLITEAMNLAYADRNRYAADSDFVPVPTAGLLRTSYLKERARLISFDRAMGPAAPGTPKGAALAPNASAPHNSGYSTSHMSIVDGDGSVVSMTATIEMAFGSRVMTRGFLLNNELTDFSFIPEIDGLPVANRVEGGKRPRSTMSPTIVLDGAGKPYLIIGSPGGPFIAPYVIKTLIGVLDWDMSVQSAIALPNFANRNGPIELEADTALGDLAPILRALGHDVKSRRLRSGLHGIRATETGYEGGADPRLHGAARGE